MPLLVGYYHADSPAGRASRQAALRFGLPVLWGHPSVGAGRSLSEPHRRGIPWLYTECPSGGWLHQEIADRYTRGVLNVMRHLGMLPGDAPMSPVEHDLIGEGDIDQSVVAPVAGFLVPRVNLLDTVAAGDLLGVIEDLTGQPLAELRAPAAGTLVLRRNSPVVAAGEITFLMT
jgi:predicted deacylase